MATDRPSLPRPRQLALVASTLTRRTELPVLDDYRDDAETVVHVDRDRILRELRDALSSTESLVSAAAHQFDLMPGGPPSEFERRARRVGDLLAAAGEAALRALGVIERLAD